LLRSNQGFNHPVETANLRRKQVTMFSLRTFWQQVTLRAFVAVLMSIAVPLSSQGLTSDDHDRRNNDTETPIKHVIVLIGENRTFDHIFGTYVPRSRKESVSNLLSKGIINADGTPGPNFAKAAQPEQ
jgi:phospholipase C